MKTFQIQIECILFFNLCKNYRFTYNLVSIYHRLKAWQIASFRCNVLASDYTDATKISLISKKLRHNDLIALRDVINVFPRIG